MVIMVEVVHRRGGSESVGQSSVRVFVFHVTLSLVGSQQQSGIGRMSSV